MPALTGRVQFVHLAKRGQRVGRNASRPVTIFICPASTPSAGKVASALRVRYFMASDVSTRPSAFATTEVTLTGQDKRLKWIVILVIAEVHSGHVRAMSVPEHALYTVN